MPLWFFQLRLLLWRQLRLDKVAQSVVAMRAAPDEVVTAPNQEKETATPAKESATTTAKKNKKKKKKAKKQKIEPVIEIGAMCVCVLHL